MGKTEILQQWLDKGKDDLRAAEYLSTMHNPTPDEIICFLCQQSAEKYLKAFIFSLDIEPEKNHDLEYLLEICQKHNTEFSVLLSNIDVLNRYAVFPHYPNDLDISNEDMKTAIANAKSIQEFVVKIFNDVVQKASEANNKEP
ncbi:HEPN domain-containing protein [Treponema sp. R80B11-R83G3]